MENQTGAEILKERSPLVLGLFGKRTEVFEGFDKLLVDRQHLFPVGDLEFVLLLTVPLPNDDPYPSSRRDGCSYDRRILFDSFDDDPTCGRQNSNCKDTGEKLADRLSHWQAA